MRFSLFCMCWTRLVLIQVFLLGESVYIIIERTAYGYVAGVDIRIR